MVITRRQRVDYLKFRDRYNESWDKVRYTREGKRLGIDLGKWYLRAREITFGVRAGRGNYVYGPDAAYMCMYLGEEQDLATGTFKKESILTLDTGADGFLASSGGLKNPLAEPAEVGDLVVVKCDLQFVFKNNMLGNANILLPFALYDKFETVDVITHQKKMLSESNYVPILNLNVYFDIEGMLELTEEDYESSLNDTKIWNMNEIGGFRERDYVSKRAKTGRMEPPQCFRSEEVRFYNLVWREDDIITGIPGVVEVRKHKHWFIGNYNPGVYRSSKDIERESFVKLPLCGLIGTLVETKLVKHGLSKYGDYIEGDDHETMFYKILFKDRLPVWVDAPVWKCPEELSLPIYLPIP